MAEPLPAAGSESVALSGRDRVGLAALLLLLPLLRFFIAQVGGFDLHFDEAQYWEWSQRLDWSYATKGPLVAWLIAASTALFGHGEWQVRLFAWLAYDLFLFLLFGFARQLWQSRRAGWWAVALGLTTPLYFPLGQVMTTDVFLFVCWTWAMWAAWRALERRQTSAWYETRRGGRASAVWPSSASGCCRCSSDWGCWRRPSGRRELMRWPPWGRRAAGAADVESGPVVERRPRLGDAPSRTGPSDRR
ncbi:MAG: glycosyltransferase family 39 protein [Candidatus Competibacter sp.]